MNNSTNNTLFIYVTTPNLETARTISKAVVGEKLAACTNLLPQMESHYRWENGVQTAVENVLLIKTAQENYPAVEKRVKELHPYDVPCIVSIPIKSGSPDYLDWIYTSIR